MEHPDYKNFASLRHCSKFKNGDWGEPTMKGVDVAQNMTELLEKSY